MIDEALNFGGKENCRADGRSPRFPWVRRNLAEVTADEIFSLLNWKVAWSVARNTLYVGDSSQLRLGTEFYTGLFGSLCRSITRWHI
ncbi:MAG: hypothetical protein CM15mP49_33090 [Actinomycetota bacterium]|nr:MAG: hypothetical protein CM15mP49_33090 [Actinomycetota bacterium]